MGRKPRRYQSGNLVVPAWILAPHNWITWLRMAPVFPSSIGLCHFIFYFFYGCKIQINHSLAHATTGLATFFLLKNCCPLYSSTSRINLQADKLAEKNVNMSQYGYFLQSNILINANELIFFLSKVPTQYILSGTLLKIKMDTDRLNPTIQI